MVFKEREELYLALSKKDLQELCRTHGLSYNSTKGHLAKLLVDYFNKRASSQANPKAHRKRRRSPLPGLVAEESEEISKEGGTPQVHWQMESSVSKGKQNFAKDNAANSHHLRYGKEDSDCHQLGYSCQEGFVIKNAFQKLPLKQRGNIMNSNEISSGSGLASSSVMFADVPTSFQFFVRADEGINLYVDLSSSPLNWVKRMNDEVSINQKAYRDRSWSIYHELKGSREKGVELSYQDNIDVFIDVEEPPTKRSDEKKESSKSSLTSVVHDGSVDTIEFLFEGNQSSTSCAISYGVECSNSGGPHCSLFAQKFTHSLEKDSVANDSLVLLGSSLDHNIHIHTENIQHLLNDRILPVNTDMPNAQSISRGKLPIINTFEKSDVSPKIFSGRVVHKCEGIHVHLEDGLSGKLFPSAGVSEKSMASSQHGSEQPIPKSQAEIIHSDRRGLVDDMPQEQRRGSLTSPIIDNVGLGPSEEQCNKSSVKEKTSSGGDTVNEVIYKACRSSSLSDLSKSKRQQTFAEVSKGSMIDLRSRKALARTTIYNHASFPRRSMRLVLK